MLQHSFPNIWRLIRIIALIQIFNLVVGYGAWLTYGSQISAWALLAFSVASTFLFLATKKASEHQEFPK